MNEIITTLPITTKEIAAIVHQKRERFLEVRIGDKSICTLQWRESLLSDGTDKWWLASPSGFLAMGVTESEAALKALEYFKYKRKGNE